MHRSHDGPARRAAHSRRGGRLGRPSSVPPGVVARLRRGRATAPSRRWPRDGRRDVPVHRRAPGGHRHARAGPAVLGGVRPHDDVPRRAGRAAPALDHDRRAAHAGLSAGPFGPASGRTTRRPTTPARPRTCRGRADGHVRVRAVAVRRTPATTDAGEDRFGLADRLPDGLVALPHFAGRRPRPDPQRRRPRRPGLRRRPAGRGARHPQPDPGGVRHGATIRWTQLGYGRTSST